MGAACCGGHGKNGKNKGDKYKENLEPTRPVNASEGLSANPQIKSANNIEEIKIDNSNTKPDTNQAKPSEQAGHPQGGFEKFNSNLFPEASGSLYKPQEIGQAKPLQPSLIRNEDHPALHKITEMNKIPDEYSQRPLELSKHDSNQIDFHVSELHDRSELVDLDMSRKLSYDFRSGQMEAQLRPQFSLQDSIYEEGNELLAEIKETPNRVKLQPEDDSSKNLIYTYRADCLKSLPQNQQQFVKYIELMSLPTQSPDMLDDNLLDNCYQADSRVQVKNNLITAANDRIGDIVLPVWDAFKFTSTDYVERQSKNFIDQNFSFDQKTLKSEGLKEVRIRDQHNPVIFHEETMAEGIIFSDRNLTPISSALACLIHFDSKLKTKLVKQLIFPQSVVYSMT